MLESPLYWNNFYTEHGMQFQITSFLYNLFKLETHLNQTSSILESSLYRTPLYIEHDLWSQIYFF